MERTKQGEFAWTDLSAKDLDAQTAFYEGLFGWRSSDFPVDDGSVYRVFTLAGGTVAAARQMDPNMAASGAPSTWNVYIAVDDVDAQVARAVELGGSIVMPAMEVMGRARVAAVTDPTGATVLLWRDAKPDPAAIYGAPGTLAWCDLVTRDPLKAADFFTKLLGWNIVRGDQGPAPYWQAEIDGYGEGGIMGMPPMVPPEVPAYWIDYFGSADIDADVAKARGLGASVLVDTMTISDMVSFAVLEDPAGATFALMQLLDGM